MRRGWLSHSVWLSLAALALCADAAWGQSTPSRLPPLTDLEFPDDLAPAPALPPAPVPSLMPAPAPSPPRTSAPTVQSASSPLFVESPLSMPGQTAVPAGNNASGLQSLIAPIQGCDECPTHAIVGLVGYDSWRGVADDSWQNNGLHTGFNYGTRLGSFSEWTGIGGQIGGTVGIYNWSGNDYGPPADQNKAATQGFFTYGLYRKFAADSPFSAGIVQDWMAVNNFGSFGANATMSQLRMQAGYALNDAVEIGVWGTVRVFDQTRNIAYLGVGPTTFRPVDQVSLFYHYKWSPGGADTWLSVGVPEVDRLAGGGSLGSWLVSLTANVPLTDRVGIYNSITYMHPSARPSAAASEEDSWNFSIGLAFYSGRTARSSTVAGRCWLPLMPVANNGSFLVDASNH